MLVALSGSAIGGPGVDESKLPPPDRSADGIGIVDVATHKVLRIVKSGDDPESFDVSRDGKTLYVSNEDAGELTVLDLAAGKIVKRVKVGEEPEGVKIRPDGRVVYVTSEGDGEITAVDTTTYAVVGHMKTEARPRGIAFTADSALAFVTCENGRAMAGGGVEGVVNVLDAKLHKVLGAIAIAEAGGRADGGQAHGHRDVARQQDGVCHARPREGHRGHRRRHAQGHAHVRRRG